MSVSALTNKHITRVANAGGDVTTIDQTWLETVVTWLASNGLTSSLMFWTDAAFGVTKTGSNLNKIFDLGTTLLPRGGDYTPVTPANTVYGATVFGSNSKPGWTNTSGGYGRFGGGRFNNIRRKWQITMVAAYKRPSGTNQATLLASGQFNTAMGLFHTSGTPGNVSFMLFDSTDALQLTATKAPASATATIIAAGTFDGTNQKAWVEAVAGTNVTGFADNRQMTHETGLRGSCNQNIRPFLGSGSINSNFDYPSTFVFSNAEADFIGNSLIVFETDIGATRLGSLTTLIRGRVGS